MPAPSTPLRARGSSLARGEAAGSGATCFGVYDEGNGLFSVHMRPCSAVLVAEVTAALDLPGRLWDVGLRGRTVMPRPLHPAQLLLGRPPLAIVHGTDTDGIPSGVGRRAHEAEGLVAAARVALPAASGRKFAFFLREDEHGVLYTRDPAVLRETVRAFVGGTIDELAAWNEAPNLDDRVLAPLLLPLSPDAWRVLDLERRKGFWLVHLDAIAAPPDTRPVEARRWVGAPGVSWRDGWSW